MKFPYLTPESIEDAAENLRRRGDAGGDRGPVDLDALIYDHLCDTEDLIFDDEHPLPLENGEEVLGKFFPLRGKILVHAPLKTEQRLGRYRFTVAHELGHWVLHRPLFLAEAAQVPLFAGPGEVELTSLNRAVFPPENRSPSPEEWQANQFASHLLVPTATLKDEFTARFGAPPHPLRDGRIVYAPTMRLLARDLAAKKARRKPPLHERFGLSVEAMAVTLLQRGLVVES